MTQTLARYSKVMEIVGDILKVRVPPTSGDQARVAFDDLALVEDPGGFSSLARAIRLDDDLVSLQVFVGTKGLSTEASVRFLGHPMRVTYSANILGRVFRGDGEPFDAGPDLSQDPKLAIGGPSVNPAKRLLASKMIRTDVPMIDVFNSLVESQKIPIFSVAGEPYNQLLARIGIQADADIVVFGGLGLIFDDYHFFLRRFEDAGVFARTVMFVNLASDPVVERLLVPDMALAVAEKFAVEEGKRVLVLLTDMTAYADAMKEVGIAMEAVPSNRGYMGDLYSQLARRYEKAADYKDGGSLTILTVTTMPGDDVTHPVPDNTGYITEGQFYLHDGMLDPFGSLSRLKQHVIGKVTREDHGQIMNTMIRFYSNAREAEQKQAMAFELSELDQQLLRFGQLFRERFMAIDVSLPLEKALDLCWQTLAECFEPEMLLMKSALIDKYYPRKAQVGAETADLNAA
ncbi:H+transporting two-sector ATPase alpha/beta subunit central region [Thiorhodococcus drewsii AZ1]|uniref:H+transporting two-sector ATPase alpha/beta subunit central region n=1 Tax=Thiorhodococcus drewsii AZ1 TaxID=765913 RepID=G2E4P6_9GAMM|nr:V-type ATP synthase subunit B [Thiorhodococcus drewsii]EGV29522.1 H+transporting two-sector ATPase alpha/beta subunit central region [Thiorhodococcus drewsii AZ1]